MSSLFDGQTSLESKYFQGANWLKVFYHNVDGGTFESGDEVMFSLNKDKFSVLKYVNEMFQYKGKYEMMIECPSDEPSHSGFVWWRQSKFPKKDDPIETTGEKVEGFELNPKSTWNESADNDDFTGLSRSNSGHTFFDGTSSSEGHWYFAVGLLLFQSGGPKTIPCYYYGREIALWIRVPAMTDKRNCTKIKISIYLLCSLLIF